jgi:hypothetical protein
VRNVLGRRNSEMLLNVCLFLFSSIFFIFYLFVVLCVHMCARMHACAYVCARACMYVLSQRFCFRFLSVK